MTTAFVIWPPPWVAAFLFFGTHCWPPAIGRISKLASETESVRLKRGRAKEATTVRFSLKHEKALHTAAVFQDSDSWSWMPNSIFRSQKTGTTFHQLSLCHLSMLLETHTSGLESQVTCAAALDIVGHLLHPWEGQAA